MKICAHPIIIKKDNTKGKKDDTNLHQYKWEGTWNQDHMLVPCRKCGVCKEKISKEWVQRILHEYESSGYKGYFVTLTYEDIFEPIKGVSKEEMTLFLKRLRKNLKKSIKYFLCGEYGEDKGRAHYHALIFNVCGEKDKEIIQKSWGYGIADIRPIFHARARYVVDYMDKTQEEELIAKRNQPFHMKSKGLGKNWFINNINEIQESGMTDNGIPIGIPRYYMKKLEDETIENGKIIKEYLMEPYEEEKKQLTLLQREDERWEQYTNKEKYKHILQMEANIRAKRTARGGK